MAAQDAELVRCKCGHLAECHDDGAYCLHCSCQSAPEPCPRCGGRGQVHYPGDHIVDCELCTALIDGSESV